MFDTAPPKREQTAVTAIIVMFVGNHVSPRTTCVLLWAHQPGEFGKVGIYEKYLLGNLDVETQKGKLKGTQSVS